MANKKHKVWIILDKEQQPYVGFWFTKKDATRGHCDHLGYMKWKEAYNAGDRCVEAKLKYSLV